MTKKDIAKGVGTAGAIAILFALYQDIRIELNDLRDRLTVVETLTKEVKNERH